MLIIFILDTSKQVLWQTVNALMKCHIRWHHISLHCLLRYNQSSEIHHFIEILTGNPLKYKVPEKIHQNEKDYLDSSFISYFLLKPQFICFSYKCEVPEHSDDSARKFSLVD